MDIKKKKHPNKNSCLVLRCLCAIMFNGLCVCVCVRVGQTFSQNPAAVLTTRLRYFQFSGPCETDGECEKQAPDAIWVFSPIVAVACH